jgi:hypothetical protein
LRRLVWQSVELAELHGLVEAQARRLISLGQDPRGREPERFPLLIARYEGQGRGAKPRPSTCPGPSSSA